MTYNILALGGGGTKGILHLGALKFLEEHNLMKNFEGIYGCSVGSIFATALGFGLNVESLERMCKNFLSFESLTKLSFNELEQSLKKKGLFEMDTFEEFIVETFASEGLDLRGKLIKDSKISLFIVSSNITRHIPTVFTGNIPVLKALRASCCIPLIFCPQIINDSVYIDGGYLTNIVLNIIPEKDRSKTLFLSIVHDDPKITPGNLEKLTHLEFLYGMYKSSCIYERKLNFRKNTINLNYELSSGISDIGPNQKKEMISRGYKLCRRFFTKAGFQEDIKGQ
jgi:NTE family protein